MNRSQTSRADPDARLVRALRLRAQGLVEGSRSWKRATEVAGGMLAMQAQDPKKPIPQPNKEELAAQVLEACRTNLADTLPLG